MTLGVVADLLKVNSLTRKQYDESKINKYSGGNISNRFLGWNNALKKAGLEIRYNTSVSDEQLLLDIKRVAKEIASKKITKSIYKEKGKYGVRTVQERFGWNDALEKAGLELNIQHNIPEEDLFKNLENVWVKVGRQPVRDDMVKSMSKYSYGPYKTRFGSWRKALEVFVEYINSDMKEDEKIEQTSENDSIQVQEIDNPCKHVTKRNPSERLKRYVLMRDGNICRLCGITIIGMENFHFDHIKPWSKCGETLFENLQVLCKDCNLAKGDLDLSDMPENSSKH
jgi:hypothetical protein